MFGWTWALSIARNNVEPLPGYLHTIYLSPEYHIVPEKYVLNSG